MKKIIILGTNYYQLPLIKKVKSLGYEVHLFGIGTGTPEQIKLDTFCCSFVDYYHPISIYDKESILEIAKNIKPIGIISIATDNAVKTISYISKRIGLISNTEECTFVSTNKYEMKKRFKEKNIPTTDFIYTDKPQELPFTYPVMVKAIDRAGKMGIIKVNNPQELPDGIKFGLAGNWQADKILIEKYAEGKEFSAESISWQGEHTVLTFTEKWSGPPNFVEEMHLQPASFDEEFRIKITTIIKNALKALDIQYGPSHTEFKVDKCGNINVIEIAARMAAENICDLVQISTGLDYLKATIDIALGKKPDLHSVSDKKFAAIKYLITEKDFEWFEWLQERSADKIYCTSPVIQPFNGRKMYRNAERYGFYIVSGDSREEVLRLLGFKNE